MYSLFSEREYEFVNESELSLSKFGADALRYGKSILSGEAVKSFPFVSSGETCIRFIEKAMRDLNDIQSTNVESLISFYSVTKDSDISESNIVISVPYVGEIDKVRGKYLNDASDILRSNVQRFVKKQIDNEYLKDAASNDAINKIKKQICRTNIDSSKTLAEIVKSPVGENVQVDSVYILNKILPFLKNFSVNFKLLLKEAAETIAAIRSSSADVVLTTSILDTVDLSTDERRKLVLYLLKGVRGYLTVRSYLAFIMVRKILNFTHTMLAYFNLYNLMIEKFPEGTRVLHESAIDGDLTKDIEDYDLYNDMLNNSASLMMVQLHRVIDRRSNDISQYCSKKGMFNYTDLIESSADKYDKSVYDNIVEIYTSFTSRVEDFENAIMSGEIFDDAQSHTGFDSSIAIKYSSILSKLAVSDPSDYSMVSAVPMDAMMIAYGELQDMDTNIEAIQTAAKQAKIRLDENKIALANAKTEQSEISINVLDEALGYLDTIDKQFKDLTVQISKSLYQRIVSLDAAFDSFLCDGSDIIVSEASDEDYLTALYENELDEITENAMSEMNEVMREFATERYKRRDGISCVYEAETTVTNTTTPDSGNNDGEKKSFANVIDTIRKWFKTLWTKASDGAAKFSNKNSQWYADHEAEILNYDCNKVSVRMLAFDDSKIESIDDDVNKVKSKIASLDFSKLGDKTPEELRALVFSNDVIPLSSVSVANENERKNFSKIVTRYYKIGTNKLGDRDPLTAAELKARLPIMIKYVKEYPQFVQKIKTVVDSCEKELESKIDDGLVKESVIDQLLSSVLYEAETEVPGSSPETKAPDTTNNDDNKSDSSDKPTESNRADVEVKGDVAAEEKKDIDASKAYTKCGRVISRDFMTFSGAITNAIRDRYMAYDDVMKKLISANKPAENAPAQTSTAPAEDAQTQAPAETTT